MAVRAPQTHIAGGVYRCKDTLTKDCDILEQMYYYPVNDVHERHDPDKCTFDTINGVLFKCRRQNDPPLFHVCDHTCTYVAEDEDEGQFTCVLTGIVHATQVMVAGGEVPEDAEESKDKGSLVKSGGSRKHSTQARSENALNTFKRLLGIIAENCENLGKAMIVYQRERDPFGNQIVDTTRTNARIAKATHCQDLAMFQRLLAVFQRNIEAFSDCLNQSHFKFSKIADLRGRTVNLTQRRIYLWIFTCFHFFSKDNSCTDIFPQLEVLAILPSRDQVAIDAINKKLGKVIIKCKTITKEITRCLRRLQRLGPESRNALRTTILSSLPREFL